MHALRRCLSDRAPIVGLAALLLAGLAAPAQATSDAAMREALAAAREERFDAIDASAVAGHRLRSYIDYHRLRAALPGASPERVNRFIADNADSPLAEWMRGRAITAYGEAEQFDALLAVADGEPAGATRRCHYYTALLENDATRAHEGGRTLWHTGHSRPAACDPLFDRLRARGVIDARAVWERAMLAWQAGNSRLMDYLLAMLDKRWHTAVTTAEKARETPRRLRQAPDCLGPRCAATDGFYRAAMARLIRDDTQAAFDGWHSIASRITVTSAARRTIEEELAFYALVRETPGTLDWVDSVLPTLDSERLRELRVRRALAERAWRDVRRWIDSMPADEREKSRWQYWLARAGEQLGDNAAAQAHYRRAAGERNFYGFAAADRLGQPYAFNMARYDVDDATRERIAALPMVQRTHALMDISEPGLATSEWLHAVRRASPQRARALGAYAAQQARTGHESWPARLVQTTIAGEMWDALAWRFPRAYNDAFTRAARHNNVDAYLLMAIARRESAYNPRVRSPAGALGLMQLMPGTARDVSRALGLDAPDTYDVLDPALNVRLGSAYFSETLARYRGNRLAAIAAYNAGPGRVDLWLDEHRAESFDLFVEAIPYRETRHYVQAVLTYRVIFQHLAQDADDGATLLHPAEKQARYHPSLIAADNG
ncbi:transglycosylase SLT domain-containing protein [Halomonas cibimaris]|uniref:Transglycosylase SLT domain-containing protein n=1 Tax=Halomonas cibimaris TaxID=657012 RepID=A0ABP7LA18_9GAMM